MSLLGYRIHYMTQDSQAVTPCCLVLICRLGQQDPELYNPFFGDNECFPMVLSANMHSKFESAEQNLMPSFITRKQTICKARASEPPIEFNATLHNLDSFNRLDYPWCSLLVGGHSLLDLNFLRKAGKEGRSPALKYDCF